MLIKQRFSIDQIHVPVKRTKTLDKSKVLELAEDILLHGQKRRSAYVQMETASF
jgi:hypothetical protein